MHLRAYLTLGSQARISDCPKLRNPWQVIELEDSSSNPNSDKRVER